MNKIHAPFGELMFLEQFVVPTYKRNISQHRRVTKNMTLGLTPKIRTTPSAKD